MPRTVSVIAAKERADRTAADTVLLDFAQRSAAHGAVVSVKGETIDIDLHGSPRLRTDDLLVLEDGRCVEVVAAPEPLIEARAADLAALARVAWHLGDRHIQAELLPNRVRVRRELETEKLLTALGARVTMIEAPFEPEGGAYAPHAAGHDDHGHGHHHDHAHDHGHHHDHDHDHAHDHGHHHGHTHKHHHG